MTRVLVVEDSATIVGYLRALLETEDDLTVTIRDDGFVDLLDPADPAWTGKDVLVCDLMLVGTTGLDIVAVAQEHHPHIRCIIHTAMRGTLTDRASLVAQVVLKPAPIDTLLGFIRGGDEQP